MSLDFIATLINEFKNHALKIKRFDLLLTLLGLTSFKAPTQLLLADK